MGKLTQLLQFGYDWKIKKSVWVTSLPLEISIEPTNVCNFRCTFCNQSDPDHFQRVAKSYLSVENARNILKKIREFGYDKTLLHWTLDGEPFLNKDFDELCLIAKEFGFTDQYFATNCLLVTPERARTLPEGVNYTFTIDYCADPEYFERVRGTAGSWEKIKDNITQMLLDDSLSRIKFVVYDISTFETTDAAKLKESAAKLRRCFPTKGRIKFLSKTFHNATGLLAMPSEDRPTNRYNLCPYPWSSMSIASNGEVVACCRDLDHKTVVGNVFEASLSDIWNGQAYQKLRRNLVNKTPYANAACAECDMPFDKSKFSARNILSSVVNRLQFFK
ncbi:MAG: SPASM domain-containing protein [Candidatus Zixiibacteriota bacterium]|nr:MAG: SPASM domain-containing protein [candidate division Zixibacteria bacterium]